MALTLDQIVTQTQIDNAGGLTSGSISEAQRDRAITKAILAMGYQLSGALSATNNPLLGKERTERVSVVKGQKLLKMRFWPITDVSDIADDDGDSLGYTKDEDFYVIDYDTSLSQIVAYTGWIERDAGFWTPGTDVYRVTYTAGYTGGSGDNFPPALREAIIQIALDDYLKRGIRHLKSAKMGDIAYSYVDMGHQKIPEDAAKILQDFMPPAW